MVANLLNNTTFICQDCGEELRLSANSSQTEFNYVCPVCGLSVPFPRIERFIDKLSDAISDSVFNSVQLNLKNSEYRVNQTRFFVVEHTTDDTFKIEVK